MKTGIVVILIGLVCGVMTIKQIKHQLEGKSLTPYSTVNCIVNPDLMGCGDKYYE